VVKALNGDPFIGMFETPITSSPGVTTLLSNLPAYRTGVSPLLRGVEIGLTHGFFLTGPFIKLGPLRATESAEIAGSLSGAGLVLILTACLSIYGAVSFQQPTVVGVKTLTGRSIAQDPLQTAEGWAQFSSGWLVGGLSGVAWAYILTQSASLARARPRAACATAG
jgi:photosystem I subunit 11